MGFCDPTYILILKLLAYSGHQLIWRLSLNVKTLKTGIEYALLNLQRLQKITNIQQLLIGSQHRCIFLPVEKEIIFGESINFTVEKRPLIL